MKTPKERAEEYGQRMTSHKIDALRYSREKTEVIRSDFLAGRRDFIENDLRRLLKRIADHNLLNRSEEEIDTVIEHLIAKAREEES